MHKFKFIIFFSFLFFFKNLKLNNFKLIPKNEYLIVLKILFLAYDRSKKTLYFWENLINFLEEYKNSTEKIISRIRNPSINLDEKIPLIKIDLNKIFFEIKNSYDSYAEIINLYLNTNELSIYSIEYINEGRNANKEFKDIFLKESFKKIFSLFTENLKLKENIFSKIFEKIIFKKSKSFLSSYLKLDKFLSDSFLENCDFNIKLYKNYKTFWELIEKSRMENLKNHYNNFFNYLINLDKSFFEKEIEKENLPLFIY